MADTTSKEFWDERYREGNTPWDYGGVPPELGDFLAELPPRQRILIPGCGSGHDVRAAAEHGHDVTGIDLSLAAVERARETLDSAKECLVCGDFFAHPFPEQSFDLVYERTFLCALPPGMRQAYADRIHSLLKPGGRLFGYFVYGEEPDPPPYPLAPGEEDELLKPRFELVTSAASRRPLSLFEGMERWQVWRKR